MITIFPHRWPAIALILVYVAAIFSAAFAIPVSGTDAERNDYAYRIATGVLPSVIALAIAQFGLIFFRRQAIAERLKDEAAIATLIGSSPNTGSDPA